MRRCCINGCRSNYSLPYVTIFLFPKNPERRKQWEEAIAQPELKVTNHSAVCIKHFPDKSIVHCIVQDDSNDKRKFKLKPNSVPSVFPLSHQTDSNMRVPVPAISRKATGMRLRRKKEKQYPTSPEINSPTDVGLSEPESLSDLLQKPPMTNRPIITVLKAEGVDPEFIPGEADDSADIEVIDISDEHEESEPLLEIPLVPSSPAPLARVREDEKGQIKDASIRKRRSSSVGSNSSNGSNDVIKSPILSMKRRKPEKPPPTVTGRQNDCYCWICHKEGTTFYCCACPRAYHQRCATEVNTSPRWVCLECRKITAGENVDSQSKTMSEISLDKFCMLLKCCITKLKLRAPAAFHQPVPVAYYSSYLDYVIHPMDLSLIEKNVKQKNYGCTESFLADVKWLAHNSFVFNGAQHPLTLNARSLVKLCEGDMTEMEVCPDCFLHAFNRSKHWFSDICRKPHPLVWAKLKGFPYWPAKVARIINNEIDARFFGAHDRAWVPVSQCYHLSKEMPTSSKPKKKGNYEIALEELNIHVGILKQKYGDFEYAPYRTPFDSANRRYMYHGIDINNIAPVDEAKDAKENLAFVPPPSGSSSVSSFSPHKQPQLQSETDAEFKNTPNSSDFGTDFSASKEMEVDGALSQDGEIDSSVILKKTTVAGVFEVTRKLDFDMPKIIDTRGSAFDVEPFENMDMHSDSTDIASVSNLNSECDTKKESVFLQPDSMDTDSVSNNRTIVFTKPSDSPLENASGLETSSNTSVQADSKSDQFATSSDPLKTDVSKSVKSEIPNNSINVNDSNSPADSLNSMLSNNSISSIINSDPDLESFKKLEDTLERINKIYSIEMDNTNTDGTNQPIEICKDGDSMEKAAVKHDVNHDVLEVQSNVISKSKEPAIEVPQILANVKKHDLFSQKLDETIKSCIAKLGINEVDMNESSSSDSSGDEDEHEKESSEDDNSDEESSSSSQSDSSSDSSSDEEDEEEDNENEMEDSTKKLEKSNDDPLKKTLVGGASVASCKNSTVETDIIEAEISIDDSVNKVTSNPPDAETQMDFSGVKTVLKSTVSTVGGLDALRLDRDSDSSYINNNYASLNSENNKSTDESPSSDLSEKPATVFGKNSNAVEASGEKSEVIGAGTLYPSILSEKDGNEKSQKPVSILKCSSQQEVVEICDSESTKSLEGNEIEKMKGISESEKMEVGSDPKKMEVVSESRKVEAVSESMKVKVVPKSEKVEIVSLEVRLHKPVMKKEVVSESEEMELISKSEKSEIVSLKDKLEESVVNMEVVSLEDGLEKPLVKMEAVSESEKMEFVSKSKKADFVSRPVKAEVVLLEDKLKIKPVGMADSSFKCESIEKSLSSNSSNSEDIDIYENMLNISPTGNELKGSELQDSSPFMELGKRKEVTMDEVLGFGNLNFQVLSIKADQKENTTSAISTHETVATVSEKSEEKTVAGIICKTLPQVDAVSDLPDKIDDPEKKKTGFIEGSVGSKLCIVGKKADSSSLVLNSVESPDSGELSIDVSEPEEKLITTQPEEEPLSMSKEKSKVKTPIDVIDLSSSDSSDSESEMSISECSSKSEAEKVDQPQKQPDDSVLIDLLSDSSENPPTSVKKDEAVVRSDKAVSNKETAIDFTNCLVQKSVKIPESDTASTKVNKGKTVNSELSFKGITTLKSTCPITSKAIGLNTFKSLGPSSSIRTGVKRSSAEDLPEKDGKKHKKDDKHDNSSCVLLIDSDISDMESNVAKTKNTDVEKVKTDNVSIVKDSIVKVSVSDTDAKDSTEIIIGLPLKPFSNQNRHNLTAEGEHISSESKLPNNNSITSDPQDTFKRRKSDASISPKDNKESHNQASNDLVSNRDIAHNKDAKFESSHKPSKAEKELKELLQTLRIKYEKQEWHHKHEMMELRHNNNLIMLELRSSLESEKRSTIENVQKLCDLQKAKAIDEAKTKQWCAVCKQPAIFYCCWNTSYCGYSCQKHHWPDHRFACSQIQPPQTTTPSDFVKIAKKPDSVDVNSRERKLVFLMKNTDDSSAATPNASVENLNQVTNQPKVQFLTPKNQIQIVTSTAGQTSTNNSNVALPYLSGSNVQFVLAPVKTVNDKNTAPALIQHKPKPFQDSSHIINKVRSRQTNLKTAIQLLKKMNKEDAETLKKRKLEENSQEEVTFSLPTSSAELASDQESNCKSADEDDDDEESMVLDDAEYEAEGMVAVGEGVELCSLKLKQCEKIGTSPTKLTRCLLSALFTMEELARSSVFGRKSNVTKQTRPALSMEIVNAILGFVMNKFPVAQRSDLVLAMNVKCKEARRKLSESSAFCTNFAAEEGDMNGQISDSTEEALEKLEDDQKFVLDEMDITSSEPAPLSKRTLNSVNVNQGAGSNAPMLQGKSILIETKGLCNETLQLKNTIQGNLPPRFITTVGSLPNTATVTCKLPQLAKNLTTLTNIIPAKNIQLLSNPNAVRLGGPGSHIVTIPRALQPCLLNNQTKVAIRPKPTIFTNDRRPVNMLQLPSNIVRLSPPGVPGKPQRLNSPVVYAVRGVNKSNAADTLPNKNVVNVQNCATTERQPIVFLEVPASPQQDGGATNKQDCSISKTQD